MKRLEDLKVKIFADGANWDEINSLTRKWYIQGLTTNPTLMSKAGITNYEKFCRRVLEVIGKLPISFEVFADDSAEMERQARVIASWGDNVYVKIPITNTQKRYELSLIQKLSHDGIKVNVTALMAPNDIMDACICLKYGASAYISVFAGRIADTGRDPMPLMKDAVENLQFYPNIELIWASPRELLNIFQADEVGCHIITATNDILKKLSLVGKDLNEYSLETVKMFYDDAQKAGYTL